MGLGRRGARALAACAVVMLAGCSAQSAQGPAPETAVLPAVAAAPVVSGWQWRDAPAGPTVMVETADVSPTAVTARVVSLALVCNDAVPTIAVSWDAPVAASGLSYGFVGEPQHEVAAAANDPRSTVVDDPLVVSRFIDEAAASQQLTVRAGGTRATFSTADDAGNLRRFRTACPDGTN